MNILGFIPARGGSKGIPKKNIYPLAGKPLIAHTIEQSLGSRINRTIVSTDSEEIASVSRQYGAEVPFLRPETLSSDKAVIKDAMQHCLDELLRRDGYQPDIIVLLQPTTPLRKAKHIDDFIDLLSSENADTVVSVSDPMEHPGDMVYWQSAGQMKFLIELDQAKLQREAYPECFFLNGLIYAFTLKSFKQNNSIYGKKVIPYRTRQIESIDIDSMDDLLIAEAIMQHQTAKI